MTALAAACLLAISGCGSSDNGVASKSGKEILHASTAAAQGASSVHVLSKISQGQLTFSLDLHLSEKGGRGRVSFLGFDFEMVRIGDTVYVKGSPAFYRRIGAVQGIPLHVPQGTWLKESASTGPLSQLAAIAELRGELARLISSSGPVAKGASITVNHQKVIELKETTKLYKGSAYVASTGKPYPIALVKSGRETGRTTFSEWNEDVSLRAPSPSVDIGHFTAK